VGIESHAASIQTAVHAVQQGGVIAYPTEAVYGLGCNPRDLTAVQRILDLKQRPAHKGLILIAANFAQVAPYVLPLTPAIQTRIFAPTSHPTTWLLPVNPDVAPLIRGEHDTLAIRFTQHPICYALCQQLGHPLISTSANLSQHEPARSAAEVQQQFGTQLTYILDAPLGNASAPSEIHDARTGAVLRTA
jgi:L-threonylcarbamoyladenylate synthase